MIINDKFLIINNEHIWYTKQNQNQLQNPKIITKIKTNGIYQRFFFLKLCRTQLVIRQDNKIDLLSFFKANNIETE